MAAKKNTYVPAAKDADGDGLVQDGTEFERPVGMELEDVPTMDVDDTEEEYVEVAPVSAPGTHVVAEGENWQTIAAFYAPVGTRRQDYAKVLFDANKIKDLRPGMVVTVV